MARFLVEVLVTAAGEAQVTGVADNIGAAFGRSSKAVDQSSLRSEATIRRTAEAAAKLKDQLSETNKSKSFIADMDALNKKLKEQADHWKRGEAGIAAWAEKEKQAAEAQRILTAQVRAGVSADSEHGKRIAELIRQHNIYQKELAETKQREAERLAQKAWKSGVSGTDQASALLGGISALTGGGGPVLAGAQNLLYFKTTLEGIEDGAGSASAGIAAIGASLTPYLPLIAAAAAGTLAFGATLKVFDYFRDVIVEGTETQVMIEQLNATLRSNGSYSGLSVRGMIELAESLALLSGGMDDPIIKAETIISRFDKIGEDTFPRVVKASVNMSRALGKSMEESATAIARALSGTQGLRGLREAGITIDPAQKKYLENLLETNRLTEYQNTLLDILEQKLGNAAEAFGNTLPGAVGRALFVYGEFREEIANQIIPALEDVLATLIEGAGGWDFILFAAKSAGTEIGDVVRKMVYGIAIAYHEWQSASDQLAATVIGTLSRIAEGFADFAPLAQFVPGMRGLAGLSDEARAAAERLNTASLKAGMSAAGHERSIVKLSQALVQHRTALDGDTEAYKGNAPPIDRVNKSLAEQARIAKQLYQLGLERAEQTRYLIELDKLASTRGLSEAERIVLEARINREHEYRVDLLKKQAQYGKEIGKALADQDRVLKDFERSVKLKLEVALVPSIKMDSTIVKQFDQSMKDFLVTFKAGEELAARNAAAYAAVGIAHEEWLAEFTDSWRESWKTTRERFEEEMQAIKDAVELGVDAGGMSEDEAERARAQVRSEMLDNYLNEWGSFFNTVGGMFGGLLQKISNAINAMQQGQQAGNQLGSAMNLSAGATAALGYMGATFAIFYEIYKMGSASLKREKARTFGDVTSASITGGEMSSPSYFDQRGKEFSLALRDLIREIEASLGAILEDLPKIVIRARKDGKEFSAYVAGVWIGTFRDAQQALEEGVRAAITQADFSSISKEFAIALKASVDLTFAELERNIETARTARRSRLGDTGEQYVDLSDEWRRQIEAERELGLAIDDSVAARNRELNALKNATLGIDTAVSDQLRALGSLNKGIAEAATGMRVSLQNQIDALLKEIDRLSRPQGPQPGGPGGGGGESGGTRPPGTTGVFSESTAESEEVQRLREEIAKLIAELEKIPEALSPEELRMGIFDALYKPFEGTQNKYSEEAKKWARMRVEIEYELVRLELIRLGMWEQYQQMFNDSLAKAKELAGQGVGGGRGRGRAQTREELRDEIAGLRADSAGALHSALFDVQQGIEDFTKRAKEAKLPAKEVAEAVRLMTEQFQRSVREQAEGFAGIGTDFTRRLREAAKFFEEARELGSGQTGLSDEQLAGMEQSSLDRLGAELSTAINQFSGLVNPMLAINRQAAELSENITAYGEAAGWTAEQIAEAQAQIAAGVEFQREQAINGIMGTLFGYLEQDAAYQAQYAEFRKSEIDLQFRLIEAQLRALDVWDEATQRIFDAARDAAESQLTAGGGSGYTSLASEGINVWEELDRAKERILDQIEKWNLSPLGELTQKASEMMTSFTKLMEDVEKVKPTGWDFTGLAIEAFEKAKAGFIAGIFDSIEDEVEGSPLVRRLNEINAQFDDIYAALTAIGASQADLQRAELLRLQAVERAIEEWLSPIVEYLDDSRFGSLSSLSGEDRFYAAREEFRRISGLSLDELSRMSPEELVRIADLYREMGREFTAGEGYRFVESEVMGFLESLRNGIPDFLTGEGSAPLGSVSNPMAVNVEPLIAAASATTDAVNTGNVLLLDELRLANRALQVQTMRLEEINATLTTQGFSLTNVA